MRNFTPAFTFFVALLCTATFAQTPDYERFEAKTILPNNTGSSLTINPIEFTINPNPVTEKTTFLYRDTGASERFFNISVYNVLGQEVSKFKIEVNIPYIFEREKLKSGIYMVQVSGTSRVLAASKMVIR